MSQGEKQKKHTWKRVVTIIILALIILLILFIVWKLFGKQVTFIIELMKRGDEEEIGAYLNSQGEWRGLLSIFIMNVLQVVTIFFPGIAIHIASGVCFGWWKAFLMCYTGFVSGNALVFYAARKLGDRLYKLLEMDKKGNPLEEKVNHYSPTFVLMLAYLIPGIPNGFIPYFASRLDIRAKSFVAAVAGASWLQIIFNCIAGHFLVRGKIGFMIMSFAIQIALIFLIYHYRNFFLSLGSKAGLENAQGRAAENARREAEKDA